MTMVDQNNPWESLYGGTVKMKCEKCGTDISPDEIREHSGRTLCEDCYLDIVAAPKTCDPWAVYSAKNTVSQEIVLTEEQQKIFDLIKAKGPLTLEQVCSHLGISEEVFRNNFATLRHMELAKGCKMGDRVCFTLFDDQSN
jgi:recombinational DNA repair protein (RecF pathway)